MAHSQVFLLLHRSLDGKVSWWRKWQPAPVFLPGESHGQRSLAGFGPWDGRKSDMTEWITFSSTLYRSQNCCWGSPQPRNTNNEKPKSICKTLLSVAKEAKIRFSNKENFQTNTTVKTGAPHMAAKVEQRAWTCTHSRLQGRAPVSPPSDLVPERTNRGLELCPCWVERSSMLHNIKVDHMKGMDF